MNNNLILWLFLSMTVFIFTLLLSPQSNLLLILNLFINLFSQPFEPVKLSYLSSFMICSIILLSKSPLLLWHYLNEYCKNYRYTVRQLILKTGARKPIETKYLEGLFIQNNLLLIQYTVVVIQK